MDLEALSRSPIGKLVPITVDDGRGKVIDYFAYVPDPLPDKIPLSSTSFQLLEEAVLSLGRLDGEARRLPNPQMLIRPAIWQEAISSSALEGTYTTLPSALKSELLEEARTSQDVEVLDYVRATEFAFDALDRGQPLALNLIKEAHRRLVQNDPKCPAHEKGELRSRQNFIGPRSNAPITEAYFVPPPPGDYLRQGVHEWETWIHRQDIPRFVRLALGHYQFETLHPFFDGNGRLGRLIIILLMLHDQALTFPLVALSPFLHKHRVDYQEYLRQISKDGDFQPWLEFFLKGLHSQAEAGIRKTNRLHTYRDEMLEELRRHRRGLAITLAENLIGTPVVSVVQVRDTYKVSYPAAQHAIESLVELNFLDEVQLGSRNKKVFLASGVVRILEEEAEEQEPTNSPTSPEPPSEQSSAAAQDSASLP